MCVRDGDGEQVDRELDHDDRDHGVRELDALRLQDGYLLCVMDCLTRVSGMRVSGMRVSGMRVSGMRVCVGVCVLGYACVVCWRVSQSVSSQGVSMQAVSMCTHNAVNDS